MPHPVDPQQTPRAAAFQLWIHAPMPMITLFKTLDVSHVVRLSRRRHLKLNAILCWCIGHTAAQIPDFFLLPVGDQLFLFDQLAVNTVVAAKDGSIHTCDIPFSDDFHAFYQSYLSLTSQVQHSAQDYDISADYMVIGTSNLARSQIDGAVNIYAAFNNPFLIWGQYRNHLFHQSLPISFQFHHAQLDGVPAALFLDQLQITLSRFRLP